ncbi:hypothetical protein [Lacinutrix chionoecetis]
MKNHYNSIRFKEWLDKLQQESWQLELIISGFAIYGLSQAIAPLEIYHNTFQNEGQSLLMFVFTVALISCSILMFTLIVHVVLRGLWIGALGLRYVSGDIDYKKLKYAPIFDKHLRKRIGSFDKYIARLENYCSILFALSFLLVFYVVSVFLSLGLIALIAWTFFISNSENGSNPLLSVTGSILIIIVLFGIILNLIDFLTQGFLKKKRWTAVMYFPFYWLFSFITLSFLYRPLVYNFLDNKFGRRLSIFLIPLYVLIIFLTTLNYERSNYLSIDVDSSVNFADKYNYDDLIIEKGDFLSKASIPSKIIEKSYLKIFLEFSDPIEDDVFAFNSSLKPNKDTRGISSGLAFSISMNDTEKTINIDSIKTEYLKTLKSIHTIKIDSVTYTDFDFILTLNRLDQLGFETVLDIKDLKEGKHLLQIERAQKYRKTDSTIQYKVANIPFWYYKQ